MEGHQKFLRGRGVFKAKILEANYEATVEITGRRGEKKTFFGGSMDIFLLLNVEFEGLSIVNI